MKNVTKLFMAAALGAVMLLPACSDEEPAPGGDATKKTCKLLMTSTGDSSTVSMTYEGDNLIKVEEKDGSDMTTYDITWRTGRVVQIDIDQDGDKVTLKIESTDGNPTKVEEVINGEVEFYYSITWNSDNRLEKVEGFYPENPDDMLAERYTYMYDGGLLSKLITEEDGNDNGILGEMDDYTTTIEILTRDDKTNPLYGLPLYLTDFEDILSFSKNNVLTATYEYFGNKLPVSSSYEYNEHGYPTKATTNALGETIITYSCE